MRAATDMRDTILRESRRLFVEQGYAATSIKQIAQAAGCATSALYYYFEEGKSQILREVINSSVTDTMPIFQKQAEVTSLAQLLQHFGTMVIDSLPEVVTNNSWLQLEYPRLNEKEKQEVRSVFLGLHRMLTQQIARFVPTDEQAAKLAWMLVCIYNGYEQFFVRLELDKDSGKCLDDFPGFVAKTLIEGTEESATQP